MNESLDLAHFLAHADGVARFVLGLLLLASIVSWYLILTKGLQVVRMKRRSERFLGMFWDAPNLEAVAKQVQSHGTTEPFSHLLHHGFTAVEHLSRRHEASTLIDAGAPDEMLIRALRRAIEEDSARMQFGQTFLATVASTAPFVGLFGTVWGIYHALAAISVSGQSSLDKVAGPVGEALVMTGIGLAVAIPAAIAYNAFARANRNTLTQLHSFAYDVLNFLANGIKVSPQRNDARTTSDRMIALARAQGLS
jgi:biopolymer transport protein ExbB